MCIRDSLSVVRVGAVPAVHIDNMQGFGVLYYKISAMFVIDGFSEARLYLLCDVEIVEDRHLACVQFHDVGFVGRNHRYIVFHLVVDRLVVYIDVLVSGVEQVSYQGHCSSCFLKDKLWAPVSYTHLTLPTKA